MKLTDDDKRVLDERNFPEQIRKMIEDMPKDDIMRIHDFAEYVLIKERVREADMKSKEKLTDKEISKIAEKGSFDGKMTEHIDYAKETDYLIAGYKWKRDNGLNERKYEFTEETMEIKGHTLHRIRALKDFGDVKKGDLGGFIESEKNLSLKDNCWVGDEAKVFENARVYRNAKVYGKAVVFGNAEVFVNAKVFDDARVYENAMVFDNAEVSEHAGIYGSASIDGDAWVYGDATVYGEAMVYGNAKVYEDASVYDNAMVYGNAEVYGEAEVYGHSKVLDSAKITGEAEVKGTAEISEGKVLKGTINTSEKKNPELE